MSRLLTFIAFISVAITLYSLLNYYFIRKHNNAVKLKELPSILWRLVLITIILTPIATVIFSMNGHPFLAAITGFTGYSWLAFLFLFLIIHGLADIILFAFEKFGYHPSPATPRIIFILTMIINFSILIYGYYEAKNIQVEEIIVQTDKLPPNKKEISIVQLSDIHFSPIISTDSALRICSIVKAARPDIIVSTGDFLDRGIRDAEKITAIFRTMKAPLGKFAITGNHEFISGIELSTRFTEAAGFKLLRNEIIDAGSVLSLVGIDDPTYKQYTDKKPLISESALLTAADKKRFVLLLKHQPKIEDKSLGLFDLQLSGHTHGGQIFPFTLLVRIPFRYICGFYNLDKGSKLYVSRGTGTWGPPIRFLAPPEITVIRILKK